ncbi:MAG: hypothetical protein ANABAC_1537 [Anaerolineae bacterium]|nr:MAG: hypothetical protein ANABAC_1537 [Anaerolineae bacterium]
MEFEESLVWKLNTPHHPRTEKLTCIFVPMGSAPASYASKR